MRKAMKVRMRIDGMLQIADTIPRNLEPAVIARLKLIANMNIAENRLPQDGRISVRIGGEEIDIRASSVPTQFGESFVVRLLGKETVELAIDRIGLYPDQCGAIRQVLANPNGVFLTTGPTGSGKTTTLYAMLSELSDEHNKVVTVENPVEYELSSASQINIRPEIDYTFAKALRSILRQDPDIIMVGEIRDLETAEIAVQAALTGHLVFSTLHTNNALDSITRLLDMGVERFLLKACICGLMAQRLVRRLCPACAAPEAIRAEMRRAYDLDALLAAHPFVTPNPQAAPGCDHCGHSGHKGRQVIAEILPCDAGTAEIFDADSRRTITDFGVRNILQDGLLKVLEGQTSLDEVLRVSR
jgi:general secretion pathway protein E